MQDIFQFFVEYITLFLTPFGLQSYAILIAAVPFFVLIYFLYLVIIRSLKISFKKIGMPREAIGGTIFGTRLFFFAVAFLTLMSILGDEIRTYVLAGGALIGTAVGLAFSRALSNIVSGIYLLVARPFRVGDYIRLGDTEGLVLEITLNYTRILRSDHTRQFIPNSLTIDSRMTNFRVRIDDYLDERGLEYHREDFDYDSDEDTKLDNAIERLKYLTKGDEVYRYTFDEEIEKTCDRVAKEAYYTSLCEKWAEEFILLPEFFFWSSTATTITYRFAFMVIDPKEIMTKGVAFRTEVTVPDDSIKKSA
ncbi:MAG: mechanosensitive ion channel family protein [Candidatus Thorarchaeota archaeon]